MVKHATGSTKKKDTTPEATEESTKASPIDLTPLIADVNSTFEEDTEIEVSHIAGGGKRIDLVRPDGSIVRLYKGAKTAVLAGAVLEGIAIGRRIK